MIVTAILCILVGIDLNTPSYISNNIHIRFDESLTIHLNVSCNKQKGGFTIFVK